jgi:nucleoid-associated protein YgaU
VNQRLAALEDCIKRSKGVVEAAVRAGASAGEMAPANTGITTAQQALDGAKKLLKDGKNKEAMDQASKGLEDCNKTEAMAVQARDAATKRALQAQAEARIGQVTPCIEAARQAIQSAEAAGATAEELAAAKNALANSENALREARTLLAQGDPQRAISRLDAAQADCLTARDLGNKAGLAAAQKRPTSYTVVRGDSLWRISGKEMIYNNPLMWPLIYKANRDKIRDPDLIFPKQVFAIPRNYSKEEADTAVKRARTRGPWRIGDGPDYYILEGVRR